MKKILTVLLAALFVVSMSTMAFAADIAGTVKINPTKTAYVEGDTVNLAGLVIEYKVDDETKTAKFGEATGTFVFSPAKVAKETTKIDVTYTEGETVVKASFNVTVRERQNLESLIIAKQPYKLSYQYGENLDLTGLKLFYTDRDGLKYLISYPDYEIGYKCYDPYRPGQQMITITYMGLSAEFKIQVAEPIELLFVSDFTVYYKKPVNMTAFLSGTGYDRLFYTSSDPEIVTVDTDGNVQGVKKGTATITVTAVYPTGNVLQRSCNVTVKVTFWQMLIKIFLFGWIWY